MPPRYPRQLWSSVCSCSTKATFWRSPFSSASRLQYDNLDPASAMADTMRPTKSPRPPRTPIPSRPPGESATSANPALKGFRNDAITPPSPADAMTADQADRGFRNIKSIIKTHTANRMLQRKRTIDNARQERAQERAFEQQMTRQWQTGDIYAPHDLSPTEMIKSREARMNSSRKARARGFNTRSMRQRDVLDELGINPLHEYKNFSMMSEYMTEMGRIKGGRETGLRGPNQRKMAKAIRRAIGIGLMPSVHRHPELFEERFKKRGMRFTNMFPSG